MSTPIFHDLATVIRPANFDELPALEAFYLSCGYRAPVNPDDFNLIAVLGSDLLGAVRICKEQGVAVLRGMQVRQDWQRRGLGSRLLAACLPTLDRHVTYCLPYMHLEAFYGHAGFYLVDVRDLPDFLAQRLNKYRSEGQAVIAMQRSSGGELPTP
jgi:N-acetylglutamate synthase-like GNAT family acetyltransferase